MSLKNYAEKMRKLAREVESGEKIAEDDSPELRNRRIANTIRKWAEEVESEEKSDSTETI